LQRDEFVKRQRFAGTRRAELRAFKLAVLDRKQSGRLTDDEGTRLRPSASLREGVRDLVLDDDGIALFPGVGMRGLLGGQLGLKCRDTFVRFGRL
jgi:hypothetical protein